LAEYYKKFASGELIKIEQPRPIKKEKKIQKAAADATESVQKRRKKPKRPVSAFQLYFRDKYPAFRQVIPDITREDCESRLKTLWSRVGPEERAKYEKLEETERTKYEEKLHQFEESNGREVRQEGTPSSNTYVAPYPINKGNSPFRRSAAYSGNQGFVVHSALTDQIMSIASNTQASLMSPPIFENELVILDDLIKNPLRRN
jgi:hypothetical protein